VTKSQAQALYSIEYYAAESATEAHWKPICDIRVSQILYNSRFSDVKAIFSDVEVFFSDVNAIFSDVNLKKSDWDFSEQWKAGYLTSITVYFAL